MWDSTASDDRGREQPAYFQQLTDRRVETGITRTFACNAKLKPVLAVLAAISWPSSGLQTDFEHAWGRGTLPVG